MVTTKIQSFTGNIKVPGDLTVGSTLYVDATNDRVGINSATPTLALDVTTSQSTSIARIGDGAATSNALTLRNTNGDFVFRPKVGTFSDSDAFIIKGNGSLDTIKLNNAIYLTGDGKFSTNAIPTEEFEIKPGNTTDIFKVGKLEIGDVMNDGVNMGFKHADATSSFFYTNKNNGDVNLKAGSGQITAISTRANFDANGQLGIGTNTPHQSLDLWNNSFLSENTIVKSQYARITTDYVTSSTSYVNAGTISFSPIATGGKICTYLVYWYFQGFVVGYFEDENRIRIYNSTLGQELSMVSWKYTNYAGGGGRQHGNCLMGYCTTSSTSTQTFALQIVRYGGDDAIYIYDSGVTVHQITGFLD